jgi:hypothetical protein
MNNLNFVNNMKLTVGFLNETKARELQSRKGSMISLDNDAFWNVAYSL